jgi:hypothetical protein
MVASLAADVYSPECLTVRRADTTWWLSTLSHAPTAQAKAGEQQQRPTLTTATLSAIMRMDGALSVTITGVTSTTATYMLYAVNGRMLAHGSLPTVPVEDHHIHLTDPPKGPIYLRIRTEHGQELSTFVIR